MKVLGIDTTADDTCAALVADGKTVLSNVVFSQKLLHQKYGGIVPQIASREHLRNVLPAIEAAFKESSPRVKQGQILSLENIDLIAVGQAPDPALSYYHVGLTTAKTLAYVLGKPLAGVDHMEAHIFANLAVFTDLKFPLISLTAAGGHTLLVLAHGFGRYQVLGSTLDDAAGEAFDKVARLLGLGYPGGPAIDLAAQDGDPSAYIFPRPMSQKKSYGFSYSGLKTAVYLKVKELRETSATAKAGSRLGWRVGSAGWRTQGRVRELTSQQVADLAASFRAAVVDSLLAKTFKACLEFGLKRVVLGGGVAANDLIRKKASDLGKVGGVQVFYPPKNLCTDNAVGTAVLGYYQYQKKGPDDLFGLSYFRKSPLEAW